MSESQTLLGDHVAWSGRRLVITNPDAVAKIRRKELSASTAKSLAPDSCAGRWAIEKLLPRQEENPFDAAPLGTSAHALLEDFYELPAPERLEGRLEQDLRSAAYRKWPKDPDNDTLKETRRNWANEVRDVSATIFDMEDPTQVQVHATEMKFEGVLVNGVPAVGYIDRVDKLPSGSLKPLDYKSGKEPKDHRFGDPHGDQVRVYAEVIRVNTGQMPEAAEVYYTKTGNIVPVDLSDEAMADTLKRFKQSWDRHNRFLDKAEFTLKEGPLCSWCPAVNSCPVAQKHGRVDKKGDAPSAVELGIPTLRPGEKAVAAPVAEEAPLGDAGVSTVPPSSAHMDDEAEATLLPANETLEQHDMLITEGRPYDGPITPEGELDPNNYAALATFGLTQMAVEQLHAAGRNLSGREVSSLAHTLAWVVNRAQENWVGGDLPHHGLALGSHSRLRGALRTVLVTLPLPFGGTQQDWASWANKAVSRMGAIVRVSLDLFSHPVTETPWERLGSDAPAAPAPKEEPEPPVEVLPAAEVPEPAPIRPKRAPAKTRTAAKKEAKPAEDPEPSPAAADDDMPYVDVPDLEEPNY